MKSKLEIEYEILNIDTLSETEKKLFDKKLRYAAIRGGIVLLGNFIILFILYFFRGSIN